jgi:hypothetical protein
MTRSARCLTVALCILGACHEAPPIDGAEQVLAAAASDSLTVALADSLDPARVDAVTQAGQPLATLSACDDRLDGSGWDFALSPILELQIPPGFTGANQTSGIAQWTGPDGSIRVSARSGEAHTGIYGRITSECDVFVSGYPTHVDLVEMSYGRQVRALIRVRSGPTIGFEGTAKTSQGQAQLLHALRSARVNSAWGRS